jgi:hypothetical protein
VDLENPQFLFGDAGVTLPTQPHVPTPAVGPEPEPLARPEAQGAAGPSVLPAALGDEEHTADRDYLGDAPAPAAGGAGPGLALDTGGWGETGLDGESLFGESHGEPGQQGDAASEPDLGLRESVSPPAAPEARAPAREGPPAQDSPRFPIERSTLVEPASPPVRPAEERRTRIPLMRAAALAFGALLSLASLRALALRTGPTAGPLAVEGAGWVARDVSASHARDARGRRVLIVRGSLQGERSAPAPRVTLALLDARGSRLGEPVPAWLERLGDADLEPQALGTRIEQGPPERPAPATPPEAFTVLVPEPDLDATRFEIVLE